MGEKMDSWQTYEFSSIAQLSKEKFDPKKEKNHIVCVELEHISKESGRLIGSTRTNLQLSTKNVFRQGQVLFGKLRPNLKKYIYCDFDGVCSSEIWVLMPQQNIYPKFLFYLVQQEKFIASACVVSGSKMPRADWNYVSQIPFSVPSTKEQKAIADILQTWDTGIEKTEALIAAKERQFGWMCRRLLRNKSTNLKNTLGNICKIVTGKKDVNEGNPKGKYPFFTCAKNHTYCDNYSFDMEAILIAGNGYIGNPVLYEGKFEAYQRTYILHNFKDVDAEYLNYILKRDLQKKVAQEQQVGVLSYIKIKTLQSMVIPIPSLPEQKRIVSILNTAQNEIVLLEQIAEKYRIQKRGLMQKLLTGG